MTISFVYLRGIEVELKKEEVMQQAIVRLRKTCFVKESADK